MTARSHQKENVWGDRSTAGVRGQVAVKVLILGCCSYSAQYIYDTSVRFMNYYSESSSVCFNHCDIFNSNI